MLLYFHSLTAFHFNQPLALVPFNIDEQKVGGRVGVAAALWGIMEKHHSQLLMT